MQREVETRHSTGVSMMIARGGKVAIGVTSARCRPSGPGAARRRHLPHLLDDQADRLDRRLMLSRKESCSLPILSGIRAQLANVKVGVENNGNSNWSQPNGPSTIQDLLRHTSGLTYAVHGQFAVQRRYGEGAVVCRRSRQRKDFLTRDLSNAEFVVELPSCRCIAQPGDRGIIVIPPT